MKKDFLERILEFGTFICFSLLVLNVLFQITTRLFFPSFAKVWTEELSRALFVYGIAFAAPLAMKKKEYVNVDLLIDKFTGKTRLVIDLFLNLLTVLLFSVVLYVSKDFIKLGINQNSVALGYKMFWPYFSVAVMLAGILIYALLGFREIIKNSDKGGE